jgi:hypothetical protein
MMARMMRMVHNILATIPWYAHEESNPDQILVRDLFYR